MHDPPTSDAAPSRAKPACFVPPTCFHVPLTCADSRQIAQQKAQANTACDRSRASLSRWCSPSTTKARPANKAGHPPGTPSRLHAPDEIDCAGAAVHPKASATNKTRGGASGAAHQNRQNFAPAGWAAGALLHAQRLYGAEGNFWRAAVERRNNSSVCKRISLSYRPALASGGPWSVRSPTWLTPANPNPKRALHGTVPETDGFKP